MPSESHYDIMIQILINESYEGKVIEMVKSTTFRALTDELEEKIDAKVEELDISKNQYFNMALELYASLDSKFLLGLNGFSAGIDITPAELIQIRFAQWFAVADAYLEVYGEYPGLLKDTVSQGDFVKDYQAHKQVEIERLEKEIVRHAYELESISGVVLEDYQKRLLIKYRKGNAWLESDEYKREVEMDRYLEEKFPDLQKKQKEHFDRIKAELKARGE